MNANEARRIVQEALTVNWASIDDMIKSAALNGDTAISFSLDNDKLKKCANMIIQHYKDEGFMAKRDQGYDQREADGGWDNINISW